MNTSLTPADAASEVLRNPTLPAGDDERFVGFGVLGLPFASRHYLALRCIPGASFATGYRSVWHRDPAGVWTFYATNPGERSCARYFSAATPHDAVHCAIDVAWASPWSLFVGIAGVLEWHLDLESTASTRLMSRVGSRLPARVWSNRLALGALGWAAGPMLRAGRVRLAGRAPNGQRFMIAPKRFWAVTGSRAVWRGEDLGEVRPLPRQARLADFWAPQRGFFVTGGGRLEAFDPARHCTVRRTIAIG
ncbi:hypothetical protein [Mycobacterium sherrisii]|uniref:hypothetical protein n=1 Tax=Mycobacterium sherrisii TaxID=243061 RepID=UPI000A14C0E3|nr:hypothetical protein [Mycobacterium sherrisii]MCV7028012.1 hypothetical protein [Mycobacterium sherrisii]ORW84563.1 hypothetical protein AWC25_23985 [Mycobacterium sherrisii]